MLQKSNTPPQLTCSATLAVDNAHQDSLTYWEFSLGRLLLPSTKLKNFKEFYMQKKIIALAVVAAAFSAPAFADPTVYGILDAAVAHLSSDGIKSDMIAVSGGLSSSRLGVKGAEDVGSGMKVVYQVELSLDSQDNTGLGGARQKLLGVAGDFGTVATGYLQTAGYDFENKFDPAAGSSVSTIQNLTNGGATAGANGFLVGTKAGATRAQRALAYISPDMGGLVVALNYSTAISGLGNLATTDNAAGDPGNCATYTVSNTGGVTCTKAGTAIAAGTANADVKVTATLLAATYTAGPLAVGGVYASTSNPTSSANQKEYALGGSYDLGMAKLFGTYQATHNDSATVAKPNNGNTNKLYSISGVIPAGPGAVALSYAKAKIGTAAAGKNTDGSSFTAAYLYSLSKTATVYGALSKTSNGADGTQFSSDNGAQGGVATAGGSSTLLALGLKKSF
jgi:predicted porin